MNLGRVRSFILQNGLFYGLGALLVFGLKYHYSRAGSEDLHWILAPTARLVELFGGIRFEQEAGAGFISHAHHMIIGPSCAGINFLTIVFSALFFSFAYRMEGQRRKFLWLAFTMAAAYLLTLGVNALRIGAAIFLYGADIYGGWITPTRVHRIEGTLIYFFFLTLFYLAGDRAVSRLASFSTPTARGAFTFLPPFFWYMLIALIIPALHLAPIQNGGVFAEHSILVIASCIALMILLFTGRLVYHKVAGRLGLRRRNKATVRESR